MEISKAWLEACLADYFRTCPDNIISEETAFDAADIGQRMYEPPLVGIASADDPLWLRMKEAYAVGSLFRTPQEWLPGARSVIAFFAPASEAVTRSNSAERERVGSAWVSAYRYGNLFLQSASHMLEDKLREAGYAALEPCASAAFQRVYEAGSTPGIAPNLSFTSNWSVRHAAFICGLGTFGLSRGLITRAGMAGRFGTVITTAALPADARDYEGIYDYCVFCGKCAKNCPAHAITLHNGKNHSQCAQWLNNSEKDYPGNRCCGKCQVNVPCSRRAPGRKE